MAPTAHLRLTSWLPGRPANASKRQAKLNWTPSAPKTAPNAGFGRIWIVRRAIWTRKTQSFLHFSISAKKLAVFAPGPPFGAILGDFTSVFDPQSQKKRSRKRSRVTLGILWGALLTPKLIPKRSRGRFLSLRGLKTPSPAASKAPKAHKRQANASKRQAKRLQRLQKLLNAKPIPQNAKPSSTGRQAKFNLTSSQA